MSYNPRHATGDRVYQRRDAPAVAAKEFVDLVNEIDLRKPSPDTFDRTAKKIAEFLEGPEKYKYNKSSQVRRFYDQILQKTDRHRPSAAADAAESFQADLPFIRMISAYAAYALTRDHVDGNFVAFIQGGLRKVETPQDLQMFRSLFEAVIGFMPKRD